MSDPKAVKLMCCTIGEHIGDESKCTQSRRTTTLDRCDEPSGFLSNSGVVISKGQLIGARAGLFSRLEEYSVCDHHREHLGSRWYPKHNDNQCCDSNCKKKSERLVRFDFAKDCFTYTRKLYQVGDRLCQTCMKTATKENQTIASERQQAQDEESALRIQAAAERGLSVPQSLRKIVLPQIQESPYALRSEVPIRKSGSWCPPPTPSQQITKKDCLNSLLALSGKPYKPIGPLLDGTMKYSDAAPRTQRRHLASAASLVASVFTTLAPGSEMEMFREVVDSGRVEQLLDSAILPSKTTSAVVQAYNQAGTNPSARRQLLSIIADCFTYDEMKQMLPSVSEYALTEARKWRLRHGRGQIPEAQEKHRTALSMDKAMDVVDFLLEHDVLKDKAWSRTKRVTLPNGEVLDLAQAVTDIDTATLYRLYADQAARDRLQPVSRRFFYNIYKMLPLKSQKAQQCLDGSVTEGKDAIRDLTDIISILPVEEDAYVKMKTAAKMVEDHFENDLRKQAEAETSVQHHCLTFLLSEPNSEEFGQSCSHGGHDDSCQSCALLPNLVRDIEQLLESDDAKATVCNREEQILKLKEAVETLKEWQKHELRTANQRRSHNSMINWLKEKPGKRVHIHQDFANKILPRLFLETKADFYAKTGISMHVASVRAATVTGSVETTHFVHIFENNIRQDADAVIAIDRHVIRTLKTADITSGYAYPELEEVKFSSDCAACYLSTKSIVAMAEIGKEVGVTVKAVDFTEPGAGKGICDRETAICKTKSRAWLNSGHDVNEPSAVVRSMTYNNGVLDTGVALVSLKQSDLNEKKEERKESSKTRMKDVSILRNFAFINETTILARKAFGIGNGIEINISSKKSKKSLPKLKIVEDFSDFGVRRSDAPNTVRAAQQENVQPRERGLSEEPEQLLYDCDRCSKGFIKHRAFEAHMNGEKHESQPMKTSADLRRLISQYWIGEYGQYRAEKNLDRQSAVQLLSARNVVNPAELEDTQQMTMGFALQKTKGRKLFSKKQHDFMKEQMAPNGWADPTFVAHLMATCGQFERHEQLKPQQIKSFYSAMKYRVRYNERQLQPITEEELVDLAAEEVEMTIESERERFAEAIRDNEDLKTAVFEHPISFAGQQLCDSLFMRKSKPELQAIAKYLKIRAAISTKKGDLAWLIDQRLHQCECKQQAREIAALKAATQQQPTSSENRHDRELDKQHSRTSTSVREEPTPSWLESMMTSLPTFRKEQHEQYNQRRNESIRIMKAEPILRESRDERRRGRDNDWDGGGVMFGESPSKQSVASGSHSISSDRVLRSAYRQHSSTLLQPALSSPTPTSSSQVLTNTISSTLLQPALSSSTPTSSSQVLTSSISSTSATKQNKPEVWGVFSVQSHRDAYGTPQFSNK